METLFAGTFREEYRAAGRELLARRIDDLNDRLEELREAGPGVAWEGWTAKGELAHAAPEDIFSVQDLLRALGLARQALADFDAARLRASAGRGQVEGQLSLAETAA